MLYDEMKSLLPEAYFGGEEAPPYMHVEVDATGSLEDLISSIRTIGIGANSSGYIDDEGIHFHLPDDETIRVDFSKRFVFVSQPSVLELSTIGGVSPSAWQVLRFLEEPTEQALFLVLGRAPLIKKSEQTFRLCNALDRLWARERFLETRLEMVGSEEAREKGLARLMKTYEEETLGSSSEMWEFWDTFQLLLMKEKLHLQVQVRLH